MLPKRKLKLLPLLAITSLSAACSLLPGDGKESMSNAEKAKLNLQMGVRYLDMGMLDIAQEKLEAAQSLDSGNAEIYNALAVFYERIRDYEEASDSYRSAIDKDPGNFSTKNNYGRFLCDHGETEKGIKLLKEALDSPMNNRTWIALTNTGICLEKQNQIQSSEEHFRQALLLNGEYAPALLEMLKISYNNQQFMSARAFLERYKGVAAHTPTTLWYAFQTERALGNTQAADEYKQQLLTHYPTSKEAQEIKTAIDK
jgi:type IV pilus assembly protein PilF